MFDNDCTNFVSQALYHGGGARMYVAGDPHPGQRNDNRLWWQLWPKRFMSTYSWSAVNNFYKHFMTAQKRAVWVTSWKDVSVGDILLWDFSGGTLDFGHAAIVSKITSGSWKGVQYAQHSAPYDYRKLSVSLPGVRIKYPNAKVYAIRVWK
ncbi:amidase domain-containing protein [Sphaerisporangium dianthi]|uniref:Amidase domain-containing protein n=1 Tax=Sphaerisporangium dianthi TaxID=1436120 RepID=A0ABV9CTD6_9ACTN